MKPMTGVDVRIEREGRGTLFIPVSAAGRDALDELNGDLWNDSRFVEDPRTASDSLLIPDGAIARRAVADLKADGFTVAEDA